MSDRWHGIWNSRGVDSAADLSLEKLVMLNGFDSGSIAIGATEWRGNARRVAALLGIQTGESVYEIGCGSGAFLLALSEVVQCEVAGADYSAGLIATARKVFPENRFDVTNAIELDTLEQYDVVISHSMFHYLALSDAAKVVQRMLSKARSTVGIFDLPNLQTRDAAERMRRGTLPEGEYEKKYQGLNHTYFEKDWLREQVELASPGARLEFIASQIENNPQSPFRFGMIVRKAHANEATAAGACRLG
jgi:trans-aconitate methyltransferase